MEKLTEAEAHEMRDQLASLDRWRSSVSGMAAAILALLGIGATMMWRAADAAVKSSEKVATAIGELRAAQSEAEADLRVFRQEVQPFLSAGPRFTHAHNSLADQALEARVKEWVRNSYPPPWLRDNVESLGESVGELREEIRAMSRKVEDHDELEKRVFNLENVDKHHFRRIQDLEK